MFFTGKPNNYCRDAAHNEHGPLTMASRRAATFWTEVWPLSVLAASTGDEGISLRLLWYEVLAPRTLKPSGDCMQLLHRLCACPCHPHHHFRTDHLQFDHLQFDGLRVGNLFSLLLLCMSCFSVAAISVQLREKSCTYHLGPFCVLTRRPLSAFMKSLLKGGLQHGCQPIVTCLSAGRQVRPR